MRFLADIPDGDVRWLDALAKAQGKSRAAVLRDAVTAFREREEKTGVEKYFGLWERHGSKVDGLDYEASLRGGRSHVGDERPPKKKKRAK